MVQFGGGLPESPCWRPSEFSRDLTQAAMDGLLDPLIGRDELIASFRFCAAGRKQPGAER